MTLRPYVLVGLAVFVVTLGGIPARATFGAHVTSDEPQYLLTARSLGDDGDLNIADELAAGDYRDFHQVDLNPQTFPLDAAGRQISPHDPLLPVLLAVPMRLGGWVGAKVALAAIAGLLAAVTAWTAATRFAVDGRVALAIAGGFGVTSPLAMYATQVYPEIPAALATVVAVAALRSDLTRIRPCLVLLAALVAMPWLSVKYVPVVVALAIVAVPAFWRGPRRIALLSGGVLGVLALVYVLVHHRIWGGWTVYASGDHFVASGELSVVGRDPSLWGRRHRLIGLLVDRGFGLVAWNPTWLTLPLAAGGMLRRRPAGAAVLFVPLAAGWLTATFVALTMHGWWWSGRQLVVVLPLAVIAIAWWLDRVRAAVGGTAIALGLGLITWIWVVVAAATRRHVLVVNFEETANPIYRLWRLVLPDGRRLPEGTSALTLGWWAATFVLLVVGARTVGGPWVANSRRRLGGAVGAIVLAIALTFGGRDDGAEVRADQFANDSPSVR